RIDEAIYRLAIREVDWHELGLTTDSADFRNRLVASLFVDVAAINHGARAGEANRGGATDARGAACQHYHFAGKVGRFSPAHFTLFRHRLLLFVSCRPDSAVTLKPCSCRGISISTPGSARWSASRLPVRAPGHNRDFGRRQPQRCIA